jgi:hypothetical protein
MLGQFLRYQTPEMNDADSDRVAYGPCVADDHARLREAPIDECQRLSLRLRAEWKVVGRRPMDRRSVPATPRAVGSSLQSAEAADCEISDRFEPSVEPNAERMNDFCLHVPECRAEDRERRRCAYPSSEGLANGDASQPSRAAARIRTVARVRAEGWRRA